MLSQAAVMCFVPTKDSARARAFYEGTLGLHFVSEDAFALVVESAETVIRIVKIAEFTPAPYTVLGWRVQNIAEQARDLDVRGVAFERFPSMIQDELGIWTAPGGSKVAWFRDPDGNFLSISQH